jgi:hypothetical protein
MKTTDSKVTRLEDATYQAFKRAEQAKAAAHAASVKAARIQSRQAAKERRK